METKIYLAPMSGVTDLAFRLVSRMSGARHCFFEMIDARAMSYGHPKTLRILRTVKKDSPISAQLVGADPSIMLDAAEKLTALVKMSFLDINAACPAKKVLKKGAGAALLNDVPRLGKAVKKLSSNLDVPVTVKLRTGFNRKNADDCVRTAKVCQDNGAAMIFLHGRTKAEGYSGVVDYETIKAVKKALRIPVFGSGNVFSPQSAKKMIDETGCDGILVARGAMGNPWIFRNIERFIFEGKEPVYPFFKEKKHTLKKHLAYIVKYKDIIPDDMIGFMRKIAMWYLKGIPNASKVRVDLCRADSYRKLKSLIDKIR